VPGGHEDHDPDRHGEHPSSTLACYCHAPIEVQAAGHHPALLGRRRGPRAVAQALR
jgi:hypothetical protein